VALDSAVETLRAASFQTLYGTYQNFSFPAPGLVDSTNSPAVVQLQFFVNETTLPVEFGPVLDIDGDGAKTTVSASASYVLLPARLTLTYQMSYGPETKTLFLVLGAQS
jgi:hypothetical protein